MAFAGGHLAPDGVLFAAGLGVASPVPLLGALQSLPFALGGAALAFIGGRFPQIRRLFAVVGKSFPLVGGPLPLVGEPLTFAQLSFAPVEPAPPPRELFFPFREITARVAGALSRHRLIAAHTRRIPEGPKSLKTMSSGS